MKGPLVTVVIPTYNRPSFLRAALDSVLCQDFPEFKVLVVDDASPYDVALLVQAFGDPRIQLMQQPRNVGMLQNWREALCTPTTRYVATLDDDDLWLPHHLSEAI